MAKGRDFLKALFTGDGMMGTLVRGSIAAASGAFVLKGYVTAEQAEAVGSAAGTVADIAVQLLAGGVLGGLNILLSRLNKK